MAAGPVFHPLHHHPADERRNPLHALACRVGPHQGRGEVFTVGEGARRLDEGGVARRLVHTGGVGREHITRERKRPRPASPAQGPVLAHAALAAERVLAQPPEQGRGPPQVGEALGAQISRHLRQVRARGQLAVGRDAAVLRAAGAARLVVQDRGIGIALVHVPHEVRGALRAHEHPAAVGALPPGQIGEHDFIFRRRQIGERRPAPGRDEEVAVEGHRALVGRPGDQALQLAPVPLRDGRLDDEVEPRGPQPLERGLDVRQSPAPVPEVVVVGRAQRIDAHRHTAYARGLERRDALVGEQRAVGAHHYRGAVGRGVVGDFVQVVAQQRLAARQDEDRRRVHAQHLIDDLETRGRVELRGGALVRARRDVAVRALEVAAPGQIPRDHVRDVIHVSLRLAPPAAAPWPPWPPRASWPSGPPGTSPSALRCPGWGSA